MSIREWLVEMDRPADRRSAFPRCLTRRPSLASRPALATLARHGVKQIPATVNGDNSVFTSGKVTVAEQIERLRSADGTELVDQIRSIWGDNPPSEWRKAAEAPRVWLHSLASATAEVWAAAEVQWHAASGAIDDEIARIGTAVVTGNTEVILNSLHPRLLFRDGAFRFTTCEVVLPINRRQVVLIPRLTGTDTIEVEFDHAEVVTVSYPLPRARTRPTAGLAALLGPLRATALLHLRRPMAMQQLAAALHCAPSTATHHCNQLVAAGLITRERDGSTVQVRRTARGDELIELYGSRPSPTL